MSTLVFIEVLAEQGTQPQLALWCAPAYAVGSGNHVPGQVSERKGIQMRQRPTSITVIAWILIVISAINLITSTVCWNNPKVQELMAKSPLPIPAQYAMLYLGLVVTLASGIGILKGQDWARWLYVIWSAIGSIIGLATSPMKLMMLPGILFFLVVVLFLFRPIANRYFVGEHAPHAQDM